jgi:hypothetical protein
MDNYQGLPDPPSITGKHAHVGDGAAFTPLKNGIRIQHPHDYPAKTGAGATNRGRYQGGHSVKGGADETTLP